MITTEHGLANQVKQVKIESATHAGYVDAVALFIPSLNVYQKIYENQNR